MSDSSSMSPERWAEIKRLLDDSEEIPRDELSDWLDQVCGEDDDLRAELASLLEFEPQLDRLEQVAVDPTLFDEPLLDDSQDRFLDRRIGPYRLRSVLGEGGMGKVYLAVREEGFEQQVALKLMRSGLASKQDVDRFHRERQILARLEHPGIARLLDGGTTEDGRPWFAMELVDGLPIDRYCLERNLSVEAIIRLFLDVCKALQFAHRNLIVHRDLKPGNVLVLADGQVKILDFGIAKFLSEDAGASITQGRAPLTVRYASPEQLLDAQPISTASDVYSLGVMFYKSLVGCLPCGLEQMDAMQAISAIWNREPEPPSDHRPGLHRDLDAILLMALEKDPENRYGSVDQTADDLQRHLDGLPVRARPATVWYRTQKFIQRHRWGLGATAVAVLTAMVFVVALDRERQRAEGLATFLTELARTTWSERALDEESDAELRRALEAWREVDDRDSAEIARVLNEFGAFSYQRGALNRAAMLYRRSIEIRERLGLHDKAVKTRNNLAAILLLRGELDEAEEIYRRGLADRREQFGETHRLVARSLISLGTTLFLAEDFEEAEIHYAQAREIYLQDRDRDPSRATSALVGSARTAHALGRTEEAEALYREALANFKEFLSEDSPSDSAVAKDLADLLIRQDRLEEAGQLIEAARTELCLDADSWKCADARSIYGAYLAARGLEGAEDFLRRGLQGIEAVRGSEIYYARRARERLDEYSMENIR